MKKASRAVWAASKPGAVMRASSSAPSMPAPVTSNEATTIQQKMQEKKRQPSSSSSWKRRDSRGMMVMAMMPPASRWLMMSGTTKAAKYMSASLPAPNCQEMTLSRTSPMRRDRMVLAARIRAAAPMRCFCEKKLIRVSPVLRDVAPRELHPGGPGLCRARDAARRGHGPGADAAV